MASVTFQFFNRVLEAIESSTATGDTAEVELLIKEDPRVVNSTDKVGVTLLHIAADCGHAEAAKLLISHGAAVNARTTFGSTPLKFALE